MDIELGKQWKRLCEAFEVARDAYLNAESELTRKFAAIAKHQSHTNPSMAELDAAEKAWKAFEAAKKAMHGFVKTHA